MGMNLRDIKQVELLKLGDRLDVGNLKEKDILSDSRASGLNEWLSSGDSTEIGTLDVTDTPLRHFYSCSPSWLTSTSLHINIHPQLLLSQLLPLLVSLGYYASVTIKSQISVA